MKLQSFVLLALLSVTSTPWAQGGNPAGMAPDTPGINAASPAPDHLNTQDQLFLRQFTIGGQAEVDLGKLAEDKATGDSTRNFARRMVNDHGAASQKLKQLNPRVETPKEMDPEHQHIRAKLQKLNGADFDRAYLAAQVTDHQKTANLLQWQISNGQSDKLKKFSQEQLPIVVDHLQQAKLALAEVTGTSTR
jgi:putative membrane protein